MNNVNRIPTVELEEIPEGYYEYKDGDVLYIITYDEENSSYNATIAKEVNGDIPSFLFQAEVSSELSHDRILQRLKEIYKGIEQRKKGKIIHMVQKLKGKIDAISYLPEGHA